MSIDERIKYYEDRIELIHRRIDRIQQFIHTNTRDGFKISSYELLEYAARLSRDEKELAAAIETRLTLIELKK